jgi:uncharacterized membrane protein YfcA
VAADLVLDWRLVLGVVALVAAGVSKSVTGLGVPVVAVPALTALYGDLSDVIAVTIVSTTLSDTYFVIRGREHRREALYLVPVVAFGAVGIVLGARVLVAVDDLILSGVLAAVLLTFVVTTAFGLLPHASRRTSLLVSPVVGIAAGALQGSTGASGPVVTMFLLNSPVSRAGFIFAINLVFQVLDVTQLITLQRLGLYDAPTARLAGLVCIPVVAGMVLGLQLARRVDDAVFRKGVLAVLALTALLLLSRVLRAGLG